MRTSKRKKTNYLFLTSSSNTVEAKGWDVHQAKREAEKQIVQLQAHMIGLGAKDWHNLPKIISYDTFDKNGISYYNWKRI